MIPLDIEERRKILHAKIYEVNSKQSPYYDTALARLSKYSLKYNFITPPEEMVYMCKLCYPILPRKEYYIVSALYLSFCESDDCFDDPRHMMSVRINQLNSVRSVVTSDKIEPYTGCAEFFRHFVDQIEPESVRDRFKKEYLRYTDTTMNRIGDFENIPDPEDYAEFRRIDSLSELILTLMFTGVGDFRPYEEFLKTKEGVRMWSLATDNIMIVNDIMSLEKDRKAGMSYNFVECWMKNYGLTEDEAIAKLSTRAKEYFEGLLEMRELDLGPIGQDVLNKIILWLSGHVVWSITTPRFK